MEVVKSSRFWIMLAVVVSVTVLGALKVIGGDAIVGVITGLLAGFGVGKVPGKVNGGPVALAMLCGLLAGSGCTVTPSQQKLIDLGAQVGAKLGERAGKLACAKLTDPEERKLCEDAVELGAWAGAQVPGALVTACPVPQQ